MKKLTLTFLLLFSINGFAFNWKKLGDFDDGGGFYVDADNISKRNGLVYYWSMKNTPSEPSSTIYKNKADCMDEKVILMTLTVYSQLMGKGEVTKSWTPDLFTYPQPNQGVYLGMKYACNNAR